MSTAAPDATRSGAAAGASSSGPPRRVDRWAERRIRRAIEIGRAHGVYAVEADGVRFILKGGERPPPERDGGRARSPRASRPQVTSTCASVKKPNHAQRKSAQRMREHLEKKGVLPSARSGQAEEPSAEPSLTAAEPAPVEVDARMADAAAASEAADRRGQKRSASETPAPAPQSTPMSQQPSGSEGQRATSPAEPAGKRGPGLRPAGHAECRKAYAAAALESSREGRTSQG